MGAAAADMAAVATDMAAAASGLPAETRGEALLALEDVHAGHILHIVYLAL